MNNIEQHKKILDNLHTTYVSKNYDYGDSFHQSISEWGIVAGLVRIEDKWNRLKNLSKGDKQAQVHESLVDTCLDGANYLIMLAMELENKKNKENQAKFEENVRQKYAMEEETEDKDEFEIVDGYTRVHVEGDADYLVPDKWIGKFDCAAVISFRNAGRSQHWIADEIGKHQTDISKFLRSIERID